MKRRIINRTHYLLTMLICVVACSVSAGNPERLTAPPEFPDIADIPTTLSSSPIPRVSTGQIDIAFERTTLNDIVRLAGVGAVQHRGDAGGSRYWICFTLSASPNAQRVWFTSGALGGKEHSINGFYVSEIDTSQAKSANCPMLPGQLRPVSLENQLWLGSSQDQLQKKLGSPSAVKGNWWFYSYSGKVGSGEFEQFAILGARIVEGKVETLFMSQATTN